MTDKRIMDATMTDLRIPGTTTTPDFDGSWEAGVLKIQGDSYPENSFELFGPAIEWVEAYLLESSQPLKMELSLLYLNTSSIKAMMDIFDLLQEAHARGRPVSVDWYYDRGNPRVAELAEEFREECSFPFAIIMRE
jgi:hypothetical protein